MEGGGREKSLFSIWEKMQRRNIAFEQLSDIMAFRIVVPTREACYMALGRGACRLPGDPGRFKDYISTPKSNGYQSLHTGVTLREPRNQKIEVQIRTAEMHNIADNGVAAHWSYKQGDAAEPGLQQFPGSRTCWRSWTTRAPARISSRTPSSNSTRTRCSASRRRGS
ncbi:MAG: hypothetical protein WDN49_25215 [Acetobacteraceae bacterium]